jgi:hypothetical protein
MQFGLRRQREKCTALEGESGGAKASKPTIQDRLGCLALGRQSFQVSAKTLELAAAIGQRRIAFAPEGSPSIAVLFELRNPGSTPSTVQVETSEVN